MVNELEQTGFQNVFLRCQRELQNSNYWRGLGVSRVNFYEHILTAEQVNIHQVSPFVLVFFGASFEDLSF